VYRPATSGITLSDLNKDLSAVESVQKHIWRLRKLWQVTWDPACKTAVNWVSKTIRQMTCRKALKWWETKVRNCEVTPQALSPTAKSLKKRYGPKVPTTVHRSLGITYHPSKKAVIADCLENRFTSYDLCHNNHE
jgi:hypothetical protein